MLADMAEKFWMVKQEPSDYSWEALVEEGKTAWTGIRNYQARNYLREMQAGDPVLFYHSGLEKRVVGLAKVARTAYPDPTADEGPWVAVDLKPWKALPSPISLEQMKKNPRLSGLMLLRQPRLSVLPLTAEQYQILTGDCR